MRIVLLGAAGFIGTNLAIELASDQDNEITIVDRTVSHLKTVNELESNRVHLIQQDISLLTDFNLLLKNQDVVYHLLSSNIPTTSNRQIGEELSSNIVLSSNLFEACAAQNINKIVFFSSGGTVYGKESQCPLKEDTPTNPITSYGLQKITIEKLLYLYHYLHHFDYRIIRLSNPYGPYQNPNGILGAVTTFTYKALMGQDIQVYGDGSVIRDYIYISDAIKGILNIVNGSEKERIYNLGSGKGTSINSLLETIQNVLKTKVLIHYSPSRNVDVPVNYLDTTCYEKYYGKLQTISLEEGIMKTAAFLKKKYNI